MNCETRKRGKLCGKEECQHCFVRSFASVKNSRYMVQKEQNLLLISKQSSERFTFQCPKCEHVFDARLYNITAGHFCPFCTNGKLCSLEDCSRCFQRSFASDSHSKFWSSSKNSQSPREVFKISGKKFWFDCGKCGHSFEAMLSNVVKGWFCPFCANQKLCSAEDCGMCLKNSFASRERAGDWCYEKNKVKPRDIFANTLTKYWFNCGKCSHSFETSVAGVSRGSFCPYCSNISLCKSNDCGHCFKRSFASSEKAGQWLYEKNEKTPREVFISSGKKFWFKCHVCTHSFEISLNVISSAGCFCPFCSGVRMCYESDCEMCSRRSFETHERSKYWCHGKNSKSPREVFRFTQEKFWFECEKKHKFCRGLGTISNGNWCPFCKNKNRDKTPRIP
ncbi:restriction endonuclease [Golden Marseillevirus]|uniref:restriction endonuclease n=1 Tax=Golden Marseillevirus TaxID=1720526 RepID=UPI000877A8D6|nr:restriction endonuclease [Golden Marseillevirus]ALX27615.1 restriction endonuclease [Golden Marseillevirus]